MTQKKTMKLASRGKRFGAACIDLAVPAVVYIAITTALSSVRSRSMMPGFGYGMDDPFGYDFGYGYGYGYDYGFGLSGLSKAMVAAVCLLLIAYVVAECIFFSKSKSIGKAILGLQVVSSINGSPFSFWKMLLREVIVKEASGVFLLGYIWILIDEKNRGWHDKILDSYVVDLKETAKLRRPARQVTHAASSAEPAQPIQPAMTSVKPVAEPEMIAGSAGDLDSIIEKEPETSVIAPAETDMSADQDEMR